ncbi:hypothetical protein BGW80DRAFT_561365 [Lactifluus volemus]|nr:hypothetical protein BGW80DRAFT_561365 [Lactifluus volemus]
MGEDTRQPYWPQHSQNTAHRSASSNQHQANPPSDSQIRVPVQGTHVPTTTDQRTRYDGQTTGMVPAPTYFDNLSVEGTTQRMTQAQRIPGAASSAAFPPPADLSATGQVWGAGQTQFQATPSAWNDAGFSTSQGSRSLSQSQQYRCKLPTCHNLAYFDNSIHEQRYYCVTHIYTVVRDGFAAPCRRCQQMPANDHLNSSFCSRFCSRQQETPQQPTMTHSGSTPPARSVVPHGRHWERGFVVVHALTNMIPGDRGTAVPLMITSGQRARSVVARWSILAGVSVARSVSRPQRGAHLNGRRYAASTVMTDPSVSKSVILSVALNNCIIHLWGEEGLHFGIVAKQIV